MLDQAFSAGNFRDIYDHENRRGRNVDRRFFPLLVEASARITAKNESIRDLRRENEGLSQEDLNALLQPLREELGTLRHERETLVDQTIAETAATVKAAGFQLQLYATEGANGMALFPLEDSACSYFVAKQLQKNISRLYKVKPANRRAIVSQVKDLLSSKFNLYVVKTDISSFYESMRRDLIIKEIDKDQLLSLASKSHIKCILSRYGTLSNQPLGIPRGVGVSAYLSELYMRAADEEIRQIRGITYYARYVDDIIAIFSPSATDNTSEYLPLIEEAFTKRGLALNVQKTKVGLIGGANSLAFEFLGYEFTSAGGACELEMSSKKMARYKSRLDRSFATYLIHRLRDQRGASRKLLARVKFLTGNTKLSNNKRHAFTGIYYSNPELTKFGRLNGLDHYLRHWVNKLDSQSLQDRILEHSFKRGFQERPFYRYSTREIACIVEAWKHEA